MAISEDLRRTLQLAFATISATLVHQHMRIANLENLLISKGLAKEEDLELTGLREEAHIDDLMNSHFPELSHLPDLFDNI